MPVALYSFCTVPERCKRVITYVVLNTDRVSKVEGRNAGAGLTCSYGRTSVLLQMHYTVYDRVLSHGHAAGVNDYYISLQGRL